MKIKIRKVKAKNKENKSKTISRNVLEVIIAFVIAWLLYQGIAFATGTAMPIVSVVSHSMYHDNTFDKWWDENKDFYLQYNITQNEFMSFPMGNGLSRGDLLVVIQDEPEIGDVVIYNRYEGFTIVHRVIEVNNRYYITKGDNNAIADGPVIKEQLVGKAVLAVPMLGYPRLALYAIGI